MKLKRLLIRTIIGLLGMAFFLFIVLPVSLSLIVRDIPVQNDDDLAVVRRNLSSKENAFTYLALTTNINYLSYGHHDLTVMITNGTMNADLMAELTTSNRAALAHIDQALSCEFCEVPEITSFETLLSYVATFRSMARLMSLQCQWLFNTGQEQQAFDKAIEIVRFGNMVEDSGGAIINYLVGMAIKGIGLNKLEDMIPRTSLPSDLLVQYAETVSRYPGNQAGFANAFRVEYKLTSKFVDESGTRKHSMKDLGADGIESLLPKTHYFFQPNRTKKEFATTYRSMIAASSKPFCDIEMSEFSGEKGTISLPSMFFRPNAIGRILRNMILPALGGMYERKCRVDLHVSALQTLLAMKAYRNDHSKLPERLEDLVPKYMSEVPLDPYDGQKIRYIKDRHILYSVGKNLSDDGGSDVSGDSDRRPTRWTAEDITFNIDPSENPTGR